MAATAISSTSSALTKSGQAAPARPAVPLTRVAIRDSKTIAINDHVYISPPWAPGAGEPYLIARVMEFVTASSSRKGAQALASSSGTLQLRANVFLRQRDIHNKTLSDSRLLVATMHSDVFALDNVRGLCVVRHRDLIGEAPEVAAWKKREDHFYYHQFYDRYLHRYYDVIPTDRIRNAPMDVLAILRNRYSFVVAEPSMTPDLCGALRGCSVCQRWASSAESVRCDTCKLFFHMDCLTPPLASKPAKGYSWTCAPCSRRNETAAAGLPLSRTAALDASAAIASSSSSSQAEHSQNGHYTVKPVSESAQRGTGSTRGGRGRGRGRGAGVAHALARNGHFVADEVGSDQSRESTPLPNMLPIRRTIDDERGTRCYNRWPYRYFGECTIAADILDPHDSIFPRALARLGVKYQAATLTWHEQLALGLGVRGAKEVESSDGTVSPMSEDTFRFKKVTNRGQKKRKDDTPTGTPGLPNVGLPAVGSESGDTKSGLNLLRLATDRDIERGTSESVEPLFLPGLVPDKKVDKYLKVCKQQMPDVANHVGMLDRALRLLMQYSGDAGRALHELTNSTNEELKVDMWTLKESRQFDKTVLEYNGDLRFLKRAIPTKTAAQLVRYFVVWKCKQIARQLAEDRERRDKTAAEGEAKSVTPADHTSDQATRAVSPSLSIMEGEDGGQNQQLPSKQCKLCATSASSVWYKGPVSWLNRRLCVNCGIYWRKYGAEMPASHPDLVMSRKRDAAAMEEAGAGPTLGVAPPIKAAKMARTESLKAASPVANIVAIPFEPSKCILCRRMEPKKKLQQCRQCSLSIHQGCYGLNDEELADMTWLCEACNNERSLDAALIPQCILCPHTKLPFGVQDESAADGPRGGALQLATASTTATTPTTTTMTRPRKSTTSAAAPPPAPLGNLDAVKPTECCNWSHLQCALFMPEVVFSDTERMRSVEGAGNLPSWRYESVCDLCSRREGACVGCAESSCKRTFHVSCATQQPSFTLGIDLSPVKSTRRDTVVTTTFRGETGHMAAVVYCNAHKEAAKARKLLDLSDIDTATGLTATQTFANTHKGIRAGHYDVNTYPLLRRAKRFDAVLAGSISIFAKRSGSKQPSYQQHTIRLSASAAPEDDRSVDSSSLMMLDDDKSTVLQQQQRVKPSTAEPLSHTCVRCSSPYSPFWWDLPTSAEEADQGSDDWLHKARRQHDSRHVLCVRCRHSVLPRLIV